MRANNPNALDNMRPWALHLEAKEIKAYVGFYCARIFPWTKTIQGFKMKVKQEARKNVLYQNQASMQ